MTDLAQMTRAALDAATNTKQKNDGALSDPKKLAATGVGLAILPIAVEQIAKRVIPKVSDLGEQAKEKVADAASGTASSLGEQAKDAAKGMVVSKLKPGSSDEGDREGRAAPGQGGSGRRMPVQQAVDVAVPIRVAYDRWTMFEDWPEFMHRFESVEQADDTTLVFAVKVWGITRRFEAKIVEQRPDQRVEWNTTQGPAHTGVVTFHELADRLTRIEVSLDFDPQGPLQKVARGMRFTKRAVRADLHRFKALVELEEEAPGGWRGTIEDGKAKRRTERKSGGQRRRPRSPSPNGARATSSANRRSRSRS